MKKVPDDYIINIAFRSSIDKEKLLIKKYDDYDTDIKSKDLKNMMKEFKKDSQEHINKMRDKIIQLNIQE